jgi:fatty acid CoA ligase FadD9
VQVLVTRRLHSLALTGIAPASFYENGRDGERPKAHYDGLPVDFLVRAMLRLSSESGNAFRTFNTTSTHLDDGISLDTIADWVDSAGYAIDRIADFEDWTRRFTYALKRLPEGQRQHSVLPIMSHFARPQAAGSSPIRNDAFVKGAGPVPSLSEAYIHKYLDDMRRLGLLPQIRRA